jgi:hypothetical protein
VFVGCALRLEKYWVVVLRAFLLVDVLLEFVAIAAGLMSESAISRDETRA